ncbi:hypothetical protein SAMN04488508_105392 [Aquimarina spongiae]|uniref:Uncharacterized protein n=1 Tax=Aquimarina spongiae TaxID=570521 RepID=A0A1M6GQ46_9FLAO|nr:hypothetical protein SAMN04488508_105392 [Aquimarina spongiae]
MSNKNGISNKDKTAQDLRTEINYWKNKRNQRTCKQFSKMSYWEVVSTNSAL